MSYLGEKLYELRTDNDIKQKDIATELNIRNTAWSNYEKDDREPDIAMLKKLLNTLMYQLIIW
ncbi:MAG: helix-turn-helix transcriptional regulator [Peptostreptococcaceae bacterium]